jgi:putative FmdB family regulatory protein
MPIYEYRCKACGAISEHLIGIEQDESISCKNCGGQDVERVLSVASFMNRAIERAPGRTCCGREERCETPPCSDGGTCRR